MYGPGNLIDARIVDELNIHREIAYITQRAQAEELHIVNIENLILFSTRTRDAWLLDPEDDLALCLCRDGEPQSHKIVDNPQTFSVEWAAKFAIEGAAFVVNYKSGRVVTIQGYPTVEISAECDLVKKRSH